MKVEYKRNRNIKFINPYTFIPTPKNQHVKRDGLQPQSSIELHTGILKCRLFVRTPLGIPDTQLEKVVNDHSEYPFFSYEQQGKRFPVIPGSSLRGPIRSVFEAASDSCFSTLRKDTGLSRRVGNREAYKPGILKWENGSWHLYKADRYLLAADPNGIDTRFADKNYKKYEGLPQDSYISISKKGKDGPRIARTREGEELRFGDEVEFLAYTEGKGSYEKNGYPVWKGVARDVKRKKSEIDKNSMKKIGLVYIGETFSSKKHGESVFVCGQEVKEFSEEQLRKAYEGLLETLEIYRNPAINRSKGHSGYKDFEHAKKETGIPVWYEIDDKKLSLASIGRTFFRTSLNELVGERKPCINRKELCEACALFGMTGEESLGSRIRITDANVVGSYTLKKVTLKILGQPRYSYMPFYAKSSTITVIPKSYDDNNVEIAGRKFYWHNKKASEDSTIYSATEKNRMNSTLELVMPEAEFCFDIYYDGITQEQLEKLMWCIHFGENQKNGDLCHKLGHGKPLGLGSVKIVIEEKSERIFQDGVYVWDKETPLLEGTIPELKNMKALQKVMSFKGGGEDISIMYPDVFDEGGKPFSEPRKNEEARHIWYAKNKEPKRNQNDPTEMLPNVMKRDQALHAYEKISSRDYQNNSWTNSRNSKKGGRK